jgi:hypothetical protein
MRNRIFNCCGLRWESFSVETLLFVPFILMRLGMIGCTAVNIHVHLYTQTTKFRANRALALSFSPERCFDAIISNSCLSLAIKLNLYTVKIKWSRHRLLTQIGSSALPSNTKYRHCMRHHGACAVGCPGGQLELFSTANMYRGCLCHSFAKKASIHGCHMLDYNHNMLRDIT